MFSFKGGRPCLVLPVLVSLLGYGAPFVRQPSGAFIVVTPDRYHPVVEKGPGWIQYPMRGDVRVSAVPPWEERLLGPHPLSQQARQRKEKEPFKPQPGKVSWALNGTMGGRALLNQKLVDAAKQEDYQQVLDLISDELKRANGVNLATAIIRLSWAGPQHWDYLMFGGKNGRRFDALMKAIRYELVDLTNNNLVNVLVALANMASAYTPQEDLLKDLRHDLIDRMPSLEEHNMCKVLTAMQKLYKEDRPRAIFDDEFREIFLKGISGRMMGAAAENLAPMVAGPTAFMDRRQRGLPDFVEAASKATMQAVGSLGVSELALIVNAFARYGDICNFKFSPEALELLSKQSAKRLPSFTRSSEASLLVNSLLRCCEHAGIPMPSYVLPMYEKATLEGLPQFNPQHLAITLNTFARVNHKADHRYLDAVARQAEIKLRDDAFTNQGLANLISGFSSYVGGDNYILKSSLLDVCTRVLNKDRLGQLSSRHASSTVQALGKMSEVLHWRPSLSWLASVEQTACRRLPECNSREVAGFMHGLSMYCVTSPEYGRGLIDALVKQQHLIADCNGPDAASILHGISRFSYRPDETMLRLLARQIQIGLSSHLSGDSASRDWTGRLMSNILAAYAKLDWAPPDPFWEAVLEWFETTEAELSLSHVATTLWALAVLDVPSKLSSSSSNGDSPPKRRKPKAGAEGGKLQQRAVGVWDQLTDIAVKILKARDTANPGDLRQLWQAVVYAERLKPELSATSGYSALRELLVKHSVGDGGGAFEDELEGAATRVRTSFLQKQVTVVIQKVLNGRSQLEVPEGFIYVLDIIIHPLVSPPPTPKGQKPAPGTHLPVAIEVDGPTHFFVNDPERPNGKTLFKRRLLQADVGQRWAAVVPVSWFEWNALEDEQERAAFLLQRCQENGVTDLGAYFQVTTGDEIRQASERARSKIKEAVASSTQASTSPTERGSADSQASAASKPSAFQGDTQTWVEAERQRLMDLKVAQLKDLCRAENLLVGGSKGELVDRLLAAKGPAVAEEEKEERWDDVGSGGKGIQATAEVDVTRRSEVKSPPVESRKEEKVEEPPAPLKATAVPPPESSPAPLASKVVGDVMTLMGLKVAELRNLCRENGLPTSGEKRVLIERLVEQRMKQAGGQ